MSIQIKYWTNRAIDRMIDKKNDRTDGQNKRKTNRITEGQNKRQYDRKTE